MNGLSAPVRKVLLVAGLLLAQAAHAQWMEVAERYPRGSIQSEARAEQALKDIEAGRRAIDARFAESERACYDKFFATDCLLKAKDERRDAMSRMRAIEVEANTLRRRLRAEEHERMAAERAARHEAEATERIQAAPQASGGNGTE